MKLRYLLFSFVLSVCFCACKKETNNTQTTSALLLGKWYDTKTISRLYSSSGVLLGNDTVSVFTTSDFVAYYQDGSGYYSQSTTSGISLSDFTYSINGTAITEYTSSEVAGIPVTVTGISQTMLSIHVVSQVSDANDPEVTDTEIEDITYSR
jgi:hypothetical protein